MRGVCRLVLLSRFDAVLQRHGEEFLGRMGCQRRGVPKRSHRLRASAGKYLIGVKEGLALAAVLLGGTVSPGPSAACALGAPPCATHRSGSSVRVQRHRFVVP